MQMAERQASPIDGIDMMPGIALLTEARNVFDTVDGTVNRRPQYTHDNGRRVRRHIVQAGRQSLKIKSSGIITSDLDQPVT